MPSHYDAPTLIRGAVAGACATLPMTLCMTRLFRTLPPDQQYPLPPAEITAILTHRLGLGVHFTPKEQTMLTLMAHIAYGSAGGVLYGIVAEEFAQPAPIKGMIYGLFLWSISYLGWLPGLHILSSAIEHPTQRNRLMITAHLVWGTILAELFVRT